MKFAFLVHPLSEDSKALLELDNGGALRHRWGGDLLDFCKNLHRTMAAFRQSRGQRRAPQVRVVDELTGLRSVTGGEARGRLYEIPMDAGAILDDPGRAVEYMEQAVDMAAEWGARLVGLGSMTSVVGGQGTYLAERGPVAVTTGNSLTVSAAIANLHNVCAVTGIELRDETVAVVGIPGSIASAAATILAPQCGRLLLVGRRTSARAEELARRFDAELLMDIPAALRRARVIVSATSTGDCIDQNALQSGSLVVDVAVPTDVRGGRPLRNDVLILTGGMAKVPDTMSRDSMFLGFNHGVVPSCLGETMVLSLDGRAECFSLGRNLSVDGILEIGALAARHGFDFSQLLSFGVPLGDSSIAMFQKALVRRRHKSRGAANHRGPPVETAPAEPKRVRQQGRNGDVARTNGNGQPATRRDPPTASTNGKRDVSVTTGGNGSAPHGRANGSSATMNTSTSSPPPVAPPPVAAGPTCGDLAAQAAGRHARYINPVLIALGRKSDFIKTFVRGEGAYVWDAAGRRYLDFVSGFGSLNLGHNHPAVAAAVQQAVATQAPGFAQSAVNPYAAALAERLVSFAPASLEMVFLANSGTEAVEAALKLARITSARQGLLYCDRSYHGKSLGSLSVTGNPNYQRPFGDLLPRTESVPYGDLPALRESLSRRKFAAFIVEPMQCEGGMFVPPRGYLKEAQAICHRYGTLLVVDEVQTGLGRTGAMFAVDREGVEPDVMTLAKSLGGGMMPIGAMLCRRDLWIKAYGSVDTFALHTSTFGGGSLACAAALATLGVLDDGQLIENARQRGRQLYDGLAELADRCELVGQVRGQGLLLGLEFRPLPENIVEHFQATDPTGTSQFVVPGATEVIRNVPAMYVMQTLLHEYGIYTQVTRSRPGVLRVQPPLMISEEQVDWFLRSVSEASEELAFSNRITDAMIAKTGLGQHERQSPDETPLPTTR